MNQPRNNTRTGPTLAVYKVLFALTGNRCAWPDCKEPIVAPDGTILGSASTICSGRADGPRHDPNLPAKQVYGYHNLIAMCPNHKALINDRRVDENGDLAWKQFPATTLRQWKRKVEQSASGKELDPGRLRFDQTGARPAVPPPPGATGQSAHAVGGAPVAAAGPVAAGGATNTVRKTGTMAKPVPQLQPWLSLTRSDDGASFTVMIVLENVGALPAVEITGVYTINGLAWSPQMGDALVRHREDYRFPAGSAGKAKLAKLDPGARTDPFTLMFQMATDNLKNGRIELEVAAAGLKPKAFYYEFVYLLGLPDQGHGQSVKLESFDDAETAPLALAHLFPVFGRCASRNQSVGPDGLGGIRVSVEYQNDPPGEYPPWR